MILNQDPAKTLGFMDRLCKVYAEMDGTSASDATLGLPA